MRKAIILPLVLLTVSGISACGAGSEADVKTANVIEVAKFELKDGVTPAQFAPLDKAVEKQHVSKQPGFVSRETGFSDGEWLVIVHWDSIEAADASMASFSNAPSAAEFMENLDASTMTMKRYPINK